MIIFLLLGKIGERPFPLLEVVTALVSLVSKNPHLHPESSTSRNSSTRINTARNNFPDIVTSAMRKVNCLAWWIIFDSKRLISLVEAASFHSLRPPAICLTTGISKELRRRTQGRKEAIERYGNLICGGKNGESLI